MEARREEEMVDDPAPELPSSSAAAPAPPMVASAPPMVASAPPMVAPAPPLVAPAPPMVASTSNSPSNFMHTAGSANNFQAMGLATPMNMPQNMPSSSLFMHPMLASPSPSNLTFMEPRMGFQHMGSPAFSASMPSASSMYPGSPSPVLVSPMASGSNAMSNFSPFMQPTNNFGPSMPSSSFMQPMMSMPSASAATPTVPAAPFMQPMASASNGNPLAWETQTPQLPKRKVGRPSKEEVAKRAEVIQEWQRKFALMQDQHQQQQQQTMLMQMQQQMQQIQQQMHATQHMQASQPAPAQQQQQMQASQPAPAQQQIQVSQRAPAQQQQMQVSQQAPPQQQTAQQEAARQCLVCAREPISTIISCGHFVCNDCFLSVVLRNGQSGQCPSSFCRREVKPDGIITLRYS